MAKIGHFEILELVGRGSMGAVYRAVDPVIGRLVAIKVIRLFGYNDGEEAAYLKERLFQEARAAGGLSHPGIVTVHQLGTQDDQAYIVMEYIDGPTLESRLTEGTPAVPELRSRVLLEVAAALDYAHQRGVVHRDIKPLNIMLTAGGAVKITDFGIAKTLLGRTVTQTGMVLGTPFYMSPEQVQGRPLDGRSDQFALAVMAYQLLTGTKPFKGDHVTSICYQIVHTEPPSLADLSPSVPDAVARVLHRGLEKDPAKRFPTCSEFAAALIDACAQNPPQCDAAEPVASNPAMLVQTPPSPSKPLPSRKWMAPRFGAVVGTLATIALLAGGTSVLSSRFSDRSVPRHGGDQQGIAARVPEEGRIIWTGQARRGALLRIENGTASTGKVYGTFPGVPVEVRVSPAEHTLRRLNVYTSEERYATPVRETTPAGPAIFSWDPRHMTDLTLWELPSPANHWGGVVLRVNTGQLTACIIEWTTK